MATRSIYEDMIAVLFSVDVSVRQLKVDRNSSALGTAPIHRLSRTWAQVSGRTSAILEQMRRLMASTKNFGEYREALHLANPPCIPFFGMDLLP